MRERRFEIGSLMSYEVSKNWLEADADVAEASDKMDGVLLKAVDNLYSDMRKTIISGSDDIKKWCFDW